MSGRARRSTHGRAAPAGVARPRVVGLGALTPFAAACILLVSAGGCSAAVAPDDSPPEVPEETIHPPDTRPPPPSDSRLRLSVTADVQSVAEGDAAVFTVAASGARSSDPVLVEYAVSGTARPDVDYKRPNTSTTLDAGAAQAQITVATLADNESEPRETISVVLERASTPTGEVEVDTTPATVTVAEPGTVIVSVATAAAPEGEQAAFMVSVTGGVQTGISVQWETVDGTAAAGTDFTAVTGASVTFGSGSTRRTIRVATLQDQLDEHDETFEVSLTGVSPSAGVALGRATAAGTIIDDDALPQLTIEDGEAAEDAGSMSFRVLLAPASGRLVTVSYRTEDGTATAGSGADYTATTGTAQFLPGGPLQQTIQVAVVDDQEDEPDEETFTLWLYAPQNATLGDAEATGSITDNDDSEGVIEGPPRLDIADSRAGEGDGTMVFTVRMSRPSGLTATVFYETRDGTALAFPGSDYTKTEGELTFSPGVTLQQTIAVPILQDDEDEGTSERFTVKLLDPVAAVLGDDTATGVIVDDDAPVDDHGDTRADATSITQGSPISGRLETADDVDYFRFTVTADGDLYAATDAGRIGDEGYEAGTAVRFEGPAYTSTNDDSFDAVTVTNVQGSPHVNIRVSGATATRYEVAVWYTPPSESDASFDIDLRYVGTEPTETQRNVIRAAAEVWEGVISGGQPFRIIASSRWKCEDEDPSPFGDYIDDLRIYIRLSRIDGSDGAVAVAGPCVWRPGGLPLIGDVVFDTADLGSVGSDLLRRLAVHEMAHVLGFGTSSPWYGLLEDSAVDYEQANPDSTTLPDTHFSGTAAVAAFDELLNGDAYEGKKVPVENNTRRYGAGGLDAHWREAVFDTELLTPSIKRTGADDPLSKVTIAALADLGYRVDYTQAESYTLPSTSLTTLALLRSALARGDELHLGNDIRQGPVIVAEYPE